MGVSENAASVDRKINSENLPEIANFFGVTCLVMKSVIRIATTAHDRLPVVRVRSRRDLTCTDSLGDLHI